MKIIKTANKLRYVIILAGLLVTVVGFIQLLEAVHAQTWPSVNAEVTYVSIVSNRYESKSTSQYVNVKYSIDGKEHSAKNVSLNNEYHDGLVSGSNISIHYNPKNPSEVVAKASSTSYGMGALWVFIGATLIFGGARADFYDSPKNIIPKVSGAKRN